MTNTWKYHIQVFKRCLAIAFHFFSDHIYYYNHAGRGTEQPLYVTYSQSLSMRGMKEQSVTLQRGQNTQNSQCKLLDSTQRDEMCNKFQGIVFIPSSSPVPTCATVQKQGLAHHLSEQPEPAAGRNCGFGRTFEACNRHKGAEKANGSKLVHTNTISKLLAGHLQGALTHVACSISRCCMRRRLQRLLREQLKTRWWKYGMST